MTREAADQFSRQAQAYAESPTHARDADLDMVAEFAAPGAGDRCLDIAPWVRRTGLDEASIAQLTGHILAAPPTVRDAFFDLEGARIIHLRDQKLILRAEPIG